MFEKIIGHPAVKLFFEKSITHKRMAHAYLFLGPARVGKMTTARALAETLLQVGDGQMLEAHPDVTHVGRLTDEKTDALASAITIEQVREVTRRLTQSSFLPTPKVAIIDDAHTMTIEAANALLKTLEEPRGETCIILIAPDVRTIPQTIRSRAQLVRFGLVPRRTLEQELVSRGALHERAEHLARLANGRPGTALEFLADPTLLEEYVAARRVRAELLTAPVYARMQWVDLEIKGKKPAALAHEFQTWRDIFHDALLAVLGLATTGTSSGPEIEAPDAGYHLRRFNRLAQAEEAVRHHVDPRLAMEYFLC